ncbi:MAG: HAMP domain-containing protein [Flavobacteriales bacterium]|jgi:HAMP domain-containing protein
MGNKISLQYKAIAFCIALVVIALTNTVFFIKSIEIEKVSALATDDLNKLARDIVGLRVQGETYKQNAPRDYDSYFRDVALYYQQFHAGFDSVVGDHQRLQDHFSTLKEQLLWMGLAGDSAASLNEIEKLDTTMKKFEAEFSEKLGSKEEPRLEWAADVISVSLPEIDRSIQKTIDAFQAEVKNYKSRSELSAYVLSGLLVIVAVLFSFWFLAAVVQRLRRAADSCQRIADGDFSFEIPSEGNDELGNLVNSFRSVSSRFNIVLSLMDELSTSRTPQQSVDKILAICGGYFGIHWMGLFYAEVNHDVRLVAASPTSTLKRWFTRPLKAEGANLASIITRHIALGEPWIINNVKDFSVDTEDSRLLRELIQDTHAQNLFGIPLPSQGGRGAMLVLASRGDKMLAGRSGEFLFKLSPLMVNRLVAKGRPAPVKQSAMA